MSTNETSLWNRVERSLFDYSKWLDGAKQDVATGTKRVAYSYQETMDEFSGALVGNDPQKVDNYDRLAGAEAAFLAALTAPLWVPLSLISCGSDSSTGAKMASDADATADGEVSVDVVEGDTAKPDAEENDVHTEVAGPELPGEDVLPEDLLPELPEFPDLKDTYDTDPDTAKDVAEDIAEDATGDVSEDAFPWDAADVTPADVSDTLGEMTIDTAEEDTEPQDIVSYDVPSMPLQGVTFAIDPSGDQCYTIDPVKTAACITLLSDKELNAQDLFNNSSTIYVTVKKGDDAKEPAGFDTLNVPGLMSQSIKLEPFDIASDTAIWSIVKYTEYPILPLNNTSEIVGKMTATTDWVPDANGDWYQSYIMYIEGNANLNGEWYKCIWKNPAPEDTPTPGTCGEELDNL